MGTQALDAVALRDTWRVFAASRAVVLVVAVIASLTLPIDTLHAAGDLPALTHPFGGLAGRLLTPMARWDSTWYLAIADSGYGSTRTLAFFPLYPLFVRGFSAGGAPWALLLSSFAVSLVSFAVALYLLHRLVALEIGVRHARLTLLLLALWPGALFFGAPYSEGLFLALSVGCFYAVRTRRWVLAGALAAGASATRVAGILLIVPLVIIWLREERKDVRKLASLVIAPIGTLLFSAYLAVFGGHAALGWMDAQRLWHHTFVGPLVGLRHAGGAAVGGAMVLVTGTATNSFVNEPGRLVNAENALWFVLLVIVAGALVGVFRRLPLQYGAYTLAALVVPLSAPVGWQPLMSLPRFVAVLFPLFMWLAIECDERPRLRLPIVSTFGIALVGATMVYSTWHWFA